MPTASHGPPRFPRVSAETIAPAPRDADRPHGPPRFPVFPRKRSRRPRAVPTASMALSCPTTAQSMAQIHTAGVGPRASCHASRRIATTGHKVYRCDRGATLDSGPDLCSDRTVEPTRREVLQAVGAGVALTCSRAAGADRAHDDALDEALHRIHRREPESVNGLSTHA